MRASTFVKFPDTTELFGVDFGAELMANRLGVADITGYQVTLAAQADASVLTLESSARSGAEVVARFSGGVAGNVYRVIFELQLATADVAGKPVLLQRPIEIRVAAA